MSLTPLDLTKWKTAFDQLMQYLENHEADIASDFEDFGCLRDIFEYLIVRKPTAKIIYIKLNDDGTIEVFNSEKKPIRTFQNAKEYREWIVNNYTDHKRQVYM